MTKPRVWIVLYVDPDGVYDIYGVFSTEDKADAYMREAGLHKDENLEGPFTLDEMCAVFEDE